MPPAVLDLVAGAALVALLVVAFVHPPGWVEALAGVGGAAVVVADGSLRLGEAAEQVDLLLPVVAFLAAILVVAELCRAEGVFAAVGALVARTSRGSAQRLLVLTFAAASLTTAALSLDATVVLLTPVVAAAASGAGALPRPATYACARLANSASLLLPVSNLTNLLAVASLPSLSFARFAVVLAPVWLAVVLVEYAGHRLFFARDLSGASSGPTGLREGGRTFDPPLPAVPLAVVAVMLVCFAALAPLGVEPAWVAAVAAVVLWIRALTRRATDAGRLLRATHLSFSVFVLGLGVVVAALSRTFLGDLVAAAVPDDAGLLGLLFIALVAMVLGNLVNNLPATLLLVPLVAPLGPVAVLAALVGLGPGSNLTYTGSLANLLWRRTLAREGDPASARTFHAVSALVTVPTVAVGVLVLWAWAPLAI